MAGTDFAPDYTARYRLKYNDGMANHTQTWRYPGVGDGPELGAVSAAVLNYWTAISPSLWNDTAILAVSYALKDSSTFLPLAVGTVTGGIAPAGVRKKFHKANVLSFIGRTSAGHRVVFFQYGFFTAVGEDATQDDFRIFRSERTDIDNAIAALVAAGADLVGNDGNAVSWYPYANVGENDYWKGKVRNG